MPTVCILRSYTRSMHITRRMNIMHTTTSLVDIDNPDFWKKMVGEAQVEENGKHRWQEKEGRNANYSEREYERSSTCRSKLKMTLIFYFGKISQAI